MSVDSVSIVDEIAAKVIEKLQGTLTLSQGGDVKDKQDSATANFVGNSWRGNQRRGRRGAFSNRYTQPPSRNPRNNSTAQRGRNCRACGSPEHFSATAHTAFAMLAEIRGMMRGIHLVPNIND